MRKGDRPEKICAPFTVASLYIKDKTSSSFPPYNHNQQQNPSWNNQNNPNFQQFNQPFNPAQQGHQNQYNMNSHYQNNNHHNTNSHSNHNTNSHQNGSNHQRFRTSDSHSSKTSNHGNSMATSSSYNWTATKDSEVIASGGYPPSHHSSAHSNDKRLQSKDSANGNDPNLANLPPRQRKRLNLKKKGEGEQDIKKAEEKSEVSSRSASIFGTGKARDEKLVESMKKVEIGEDR